MTELIQRFTALDQRIELKDVYAKQQGRSDVLASVLLH